MDREAVHNEMERARLTFSDLVRQAAPADMRRRSNGTRWTNRQLLFHMLFGYLIVRSLMPLVHGFGHLPAGWSRRFAPTLDAGRRLRCPHRPDPPVLADEGPAKREEQLRGRVRQLCRNLDPRGARATARQEHGRQKPERREGGGRHRLIVAAPGGV